MSDTTTLERVRFWVVAYCWARSALKLSNPVGVETAAASTVRVTARTAAVEGGWGGEGGKTGGEGGVNGAGGEGGGLGQGCVIPVLAYETAVRVFSGPHNPAFPSRSRPGAPLLVRLLNVLHSLGIAPTRVLSLRLKWFRYLSMLYCTGSCPAVPVELRSRVCSFVSVLSPTGNVPDNGLLPRIINVRAVSRLSCEGRGPIILLEPTLSDSKEPNCE